MNLTIWPKRNLVILSQLVPFIMTKPPDIFAYQLFGPRCYCYLSSAKLETKTPVIKKCILIIPEPILERVVFTNIGTVVIKKQNQ